MVKGTFKFIVGDTLIGTGSLHCPADWRGLPLNRAYFCPLCASVWAVAILDEPRAFSTSHTRCRKCGGSGRLWHTQEELSTFSRELLLYELNAALLEEYGSFDI